MPDRPCPRSAAPAPRPRRVGKTVAVKHAIEDLLAAGTPPHCIVRVAADGGGWAGDAATVNASPWLGILATRAVLDTSGTGAWAVPAAFIAYLLDT